MSIDIKKFTAVELTTDKLDKLIAQHESFQVVSVSDLGSVVSKIEERIEKLGLKCRVFTEYRSASIGAMFTPIGILGIVPAIGIAAHNLATFNPDYEIGKNKVAGTVTVKYKK